LAWITARASHPRAATAREAVNMLINLEADYQMLTERQGGEMGSRDKASSRYYLLFIQAPESRKERNEYRSKGR